MAIKSALQKIHQLLNDGRTEKAIAMIEQSSAIFSQEPRSLLPLLDELDRQRKYTVLQPVLAKLQETNILPLECSIFNLRIKFRTEDYGEALAAIDSVLALSNDNAEALRTGGRIGNLTKDDGLALRYWERLAAAFANDAEAALQTARIYLRQGHYEQALEWAQRAARRRPDLTEPLQIAVGAGLEAGWPESCDPLLSRLFTTDRARALKAVSKLVQRLDCTSSARVLSSLQQRYPNDHSIADIVAKAYSEWLVAALEQELASRELDAAAFYRAARSVQPRDAHAQRALDRLSMPSLLAMREAFHSRDFSGAIENGVMAAQIDPDCFEAWQTVGRAHFTNGSIKASSDAFRRCTDLNPNDAPSWLTYGLVLNQAGERRAALLAFRRAQEKAAADVKNEADASIAALYPQLVQEALQAATDGNTELAWDASDAALLIRPEDAGMSQLRRNLLRQQRERIREAWNASSDSAVGLCQRYLEKSPDDLYVSTVLGRTLMRTRAYGEAVSVWESLCARNREDSHNYLQVARCCRALKARERGLLAAEKALHLDPTLHEAAEIADFLKSLPT